jgi:hypothetical protein
VPGLKVALASRHFIFVSLPVLATGLTCDKAICNGYLERQDKWKHAVVTGALEHLSEVLMPLRNASRSKSTTVFLMIEFCAWGALVVATVPALATAQERGAGNSVFGKAEPQLNLIYIIGAVMKPGGYSLPKNKKITVMQAVALAGGFDKTAAPGTAIIMRHSAKGARAQVPVDLNKVIQRRARDIDLGEDDVLFVQSVKKPEPQPRPICQCDSPMPTVPSRNQFGRIAL